MIKQGIFLYLVADIVGINHCAGNVVCSGTILVSVQFRLYNIYACYKAWAL